MSHRDFRDRDFLRTKEGLFFCVVGPYHPDDRVISYLRYLPDTKGKWRNETTRFKRAMPTYTIPSLLKTFELLKNDYPQYIFFSHVYNILMTAVPKDYLVEHLKPEKKLDKLFENQALDPLQKKVVQFVSCLSELSAIPVSKFGVTGSILLNIHNPMFSDIDITVYGAKNGFRIKETLTEAVSSNDFSIRRFQEEKQEIWIREKTKKHPISLTEAAQIYERKWNIGLFENTAFSIHPIKKEDELTEKYGDKISNPIKFVTIKAEVVDNVDSIFLPAIYRVQDVVVDEEIEANIEEVVSYEGLYDSLAKKGENIKAKGKLERIIDSRKGRIYDRLLVGSPDGKGREYIVLDT
ncbi:MAG: hypothetical protein JSV05_09540 [Candidatus Bathyarchaeota archaeon]|nr:MAG: hypothetical protein JSV05_09540 [Candidatus Bathyarchaeota archaeon]